MALRISRTNRVMRVTVILNRLRDILDPSGKKPVDLEDPWGDYIRGGKPALHAFANHLNRKTIFKKDRLALMPADLHSAKTVGDIAIAITYWYRNNHWTVVV